MALKQREKRFIVAASAFLGLIVAFQVFVGPALGRVGMLRRVVAEQQGVLGKIQAGSEQYKLLQNQLTQMRQRIAQQQKKQILSLVEQLQKDCGLAQKVEYVRPARAAISDKYEETSIEIKFGGITLPEIVEFLTKVESSELLVATRALEIKRTTQNSGPLDVVLQVVSVSAIEQHGRTAPTLAAAR